MPTVSQAVQELLYAVEEALTRTSDEVLLKVFPAELQALSVTFVGSSSELPSSAFILARKCTGTRQDEQEISSCHAILQVKSFLQMKNFAQNYS